jgi:Uma2 family endonuclease
MPMSAIEKKHWTADEYLAFEAASGEKHEFIDGEVYAITGASENHNLIVANTLASLVAQLRGRPCKTYPSDMLVHVTATGDYYYPDISVVCGDSDIVHNKQDMLLNPVLVIEVLSPTTEKLDRGKKFLNYRTLKSLQEYILIAQDEVLVERFVRQADGQWLLSDATSLDGAVELTPIDCHLTLADVYDKISFEAS